MTASDVTPRGGMVRAALVGCGNRGVNGLGRAILQSSTVELVAVSDVDAARMRAASETLGAPAEGSLERLLGRDDVQAVVVATNAQWHVPVALQAVRAGKHVVVEKPLADATAAARQLADEAERAGVVGLTGYQRRFTSFSRTLRDEARAIQPIQMLVTRQRGPFRIQFFFPDYYGGIMDHATHDIDLLLQVMGGRPVAVLGSVARGRIREDQTIELVSLIVEFDGGRTATLVGSMHGVQAPNVVQVIGTRVSVTSFDHKTLKVVHHSGIVEPAPALPAGLESHEVTTGGEGADTTVEMLDHFAALVCGRERENRGASLRDGEHALGIMQAAVESARTGRRVELASL